MSTGLLRRHACWQRASSPRRPSSHPLPAAAQDLKGGAAARRYPAPTSRTSIRSSSLTVNFPLIKNLYDSLLEYTPGRQGDAEPRDRTGQIAPDNTSVTLTLRKDVKFHSGSAVQRRRGRRDPEEGRRSAARQERLRDDVLREGLDGRRSRHDQAQLQGPGARAADHRSPAVHLRHRSGRHRHGRDEAGRHRRLHAGRAHRRPAHRPHRQPELLAREASRSSKDVVLDDLQRRCGGDRSARIRRRRHRLRRHLAQRACA